MRSSPSPSRVHGRRVLLQPYLAAFVPRYHGWMADAELRAQTSSERMTLAEEYAAREAWALDPLKATFIVFDAAARAGRLDGDGDDAGMVGDVNLFVLGGDEAEDYRERAAAVSVAAREAGEAAGVGGEAGGFKTGAAEETTPPLPPSAAVVEVMVMIAEPAARRRGLASEAVSLMMEWGRQRLGARVFVAKISDTNAPSLALFARLGFREARRVAAFGEVHLMRVVGDGEAAGVECRIECVEHAGAGLGEMSGEAQGRADGDGTGEGESRGT